MLKLLILLSVITVFILKVKNDVPLIFGIPVALGYFLLFQACRVFLYERFINPLARLPGPKVHHALINRFNEEGHWFKGEFEAISKSEAGQAHLLWLREYRNPTGFVTYTTLFYTRRTMPTSSGIIRYILNNPTMYDTPYFARKGLKLVLGDGLLTAEGERHKRKRKLLNPVFSTAYLKDVVLVSAEKGDRLVTKLLDSLSAQPNEGIEMTEFLTRTGLDVITSAGSSFSNGRTDVGFGYDFKPLDNPDNPLTKAYSFIFAPDSLSAMDVFLGLASSYFPHLSKLPIPRLTELRAAREAVIAHALSLVRDRAGAKNAGKDILTALISEERASDQGERERNGDCE
jgi:cytochrome P450